MNREVTGNSEAGIRDVVVVGAGPAGSAAAAMMAQKGLDVLLLDRARFPRNKACGEFLTPGCRRILEDLGVWPALTRSGLKPIRSVSLESQAGYRANYVPPNGEPAGWSMRRTLLDTALALNARDSGAEFREGVTVRSLQKDGGKVLGITARSADSETVIRARLVIGADGTHSIVARQMGVVRPIRRLQRLGIISHIQSVNSDSLRMRSRGETVCGIGPLDGGSANVTIVVPTSDSVHISGRAGEFVEERLRTRFPDLKLTGFPHNPMTIGCFGHTVRSSVADGVMLVGDAASFIDPFTGEGIYFALRGGELAAEAAQRALKAEDCSRERLYFYNDAREELAARYRLCDAVQAVVRTPAIMNRVVKSMEGNPDATAALMSVLGDLLPARRVLSPSVLAGLFMPA